VLTRKPLEGNGLVLDTYVRISHRHFHVGMAGEFFRLGQRGAIPQEFGNVRVAASRVEVGDPGCGLIGNAGEFEVFLDHEPSLPSFEIWE
jgi:hypothetical protein